MKRLFLILMTAALVAGCGPKLTPVLADFECGLAPVGSQEREAQAGEAVLAYADRFSQPAFAPRAAMTPAAVRGEVMQPLDPKRLWINWWSLDDGSLVVQPLPRPERGDAADPLAGLGLRVDAEGNVLGRRPWIDVRRGVRPSQENWDGRMRRVFTPVQAMDLDLFLGELIYVGTERGRAVFEHRLRKFGGGLTDSPPVRLMDVDGVLDFRGVFIKVLDAGPDRLRYRIVQPQPHAP